MLTGATSFDAAAGEGVAQGTISLQDSWAKSTSRPFTTQITSHLHLFAHSPSSKS
jgi:hypothetical protein